MTDVEAWVKVDFFFQSGIISALYEVDGLIRELAKAYESLKPIPPRPESTY